MLAALLRKLDGFFGKRSRNSILLFSLFIGILVGIVDFFTAPELLILYIVPIFIAAWYGGKRAGTVVAIYCAGAIFVSETVFENSQRLDGGAVWTLIVRLIAYLIIAHVVASLHESQRQQQELTGFIVHDLRSPISSSITGLLTLEQNAQNLDDLEREMVNLALVSNQRALTLVNSMLDVSKLESGKMLVQHELVQVRALVDDAIAQVLLWAKGNDVRVATDLGVDNVVLDPNLTSRVIINLLSNALKFSPAGSTVEVKAAHVRDGVRFSVQDQGPGIPPEFAETIFEPFAQVKGTQGGTGLGLTFCRLAVHAQGGKIWVESQVGKGTSMIFVLPLNQSRQEAKLPATETRG